MVRVFPPGEARHDKLLLDSRHHYPRSHQVWTALTSHEKLPSEINFGQHFLFLNSLQEIHQQKTKPKIILVVTFSEKRFLLQHGADVAKLFETENKKGQLNLFFAVVQLQ